MKSLSHVRLFESPWTVAHEAPPSMEFSRQEYWSWLSFLSPGDLPDPGIETGSPAMQVDAQMLYCSLSHQGSPERNQSASHENIRVQSVTGRQDRSVQRSRDRSMLGVSAVAGVAEAQ